MRGRKCTCGWEERDIVWFVLLLLTILSMGTLHISYQQIQAARVNQWHDTALQAGWLLDTALARVAVSPDTFPTGESSWQAIETWPEASLTAWRKFPGALHQTDPSGVEVHVIMEALSGTYRLFRFNGLAYHP